MLKTRLFFTLFATVILVFISGGFGYWLLRDQLGELQRVVSRNFEAIKLVNDFRILSAELESQYLSQLAAEEPVRISSEETLQRIRERFDEDLIQLGTLAEGDSFQEIERESIGGLDRSVRRYLALFDRVMEPGFSANSREIRVETRRRILDASYDMAERVEVVLDQLEESITTENRKMDRQITRSMGLLASGTAFATLITALVYLFLGRRIIHPVVHLTESIREVQQQNFERVIPVNSTDEIGQLASAFNDMSAELRIMKLETDQQMMQLNRERGAIIRSFPHAIFILGEDGEVSQQNAAATELMEALGEAGPLPPKIGGLARDCLRENREHRPEEIREATLLRPGETELWCLPQIFRIDIREGSGESRGWAVVLIDVTKLRWMDEMKSDMIGTVSHEIKTPLTSIRMILLLLAEKKVGDLSEKQESMVNSAVDECERLLVTLENLLQHSRIDRGETGLDLESVAASELLDEAAEGFPALAADRNLSLRLELPDEPVVVRADRIRIGQVLGNLLSNAVKHSPGGGEIVLEAGSGEDGMIRFTVRDEGPGVSRGEREKIFERFYRAQGQEKDGTGLGLWISREIVKAHGGEIGIVGDRADTVFFFELPAAGQSGHREE